MTYSLKSPPDSFTASIRPPEPPAGPDHHVPVQNGKVLHDSDNEIGLSGMGNSIYSCFNVASGPIVHKIKIGAA